MLIHNRYQLAEKAVRNNARRIVSRMSDELITKLSNSQQEIENVTQTLRQMKDEQAKFIEQGTAML